MKYVIVRSWSGFGRSYYTAKRLVPWTVGVVRAKRYSTKAFAERAAFNVAVERFRNTAYYFVESVADAEAHENRSVK